jgi:hypothetical protein
MPTSKNAPLEILITLMIFMVAWAVTPMVIGGTTLCARRIAFLLHITAWEFMAYALNVNIFSPIVAGHPSFTPFGTQTPFLQFKL